MLIVTFHTRKARISYSIWVRCNTLCFCCKLITNLRITERTLGGLDVFLPYIYDYVKSFTGKSITTDVWKAHLYTYFDKQGKDKLKALDGVDFEVIVSWILHIEI